MKLNNMKQDKSVKKAQRKTSQNQLQPLMEYEK